MSWLLWVVPLVVVVFLWTLNEVLLGRLKEIIASVLALSSFALVALAFWLSGWKVGLAALLGAFLLATLPRPVAHVIARRLVAFPDQGHDDFDRRRPNRTIAGSGTDAYLNRGEREEAEKERDRGLAVSSAMNVPVIAEALTERGATERDLAALYDRVEVHSLPSAARKEVLENPFLVAFFLENSEPYDVYDGTYARKVSLETAMRLQLWTRHNPAGKEPGKGRL